MTDLNAERLDVGIHTGVPDEVYHEDPSIDISASATILRTLYRQSPEHARNAHPRLNPAFKPSQPSDAMAAGTILHSMMLGTPEPYRIHHFEDWRSGRAKEAKAAAHADGKIPILSHQLEQLLPVAHALRQRLASEYPEIHNAMNDPWTHREATLIWREGGTMCRCRFDILPPADFGFTCDLKFTGKLAEPGEWARQLRENYLFQADLYPRALKALRGDRPEFRFIVCETEPPYGVSVHAMGPGLATIARRRVDIALRQWAYCLAMNTWPGYPPLTHYAEAPPWFEREEMERTLRDGFAAVDLMGSATAAVCQISASMGAQP